MKIIPIILCGGSGTRLWPISTPDKPKQFLKLSGSQSLLHQTLLRCKNDKIFHPKPIIIGSPEHRFLILNEAKKVGISVDVILEPCPRNSCPAITAACLYAKNREKNATFLVLAADHYIPDNKAFSDNVIKAVDDARDGYIVTFGIKPTHSATGYGYISPGQKLKNTFKVNRFIEKPDSDTAQSYMEKGCLWNSGNFLFQAETFCQEMMIFEPEIIANVANSIKNGSSDSNFFRLEERSFSKINSISIDHAIMEHSNKTAVLPVDYQWSDIGTWASLAEIMPKDEQGNAIIGNAELLESSNNIIYSQDRLTAIFGMQDTIIVSTREAVFIAPKNQAEKVRKIASLLDENKDVVANEQLDAGSLYQVNRIVLKSGEVLSPQKHHRHSKHWMVVAGKAEVVMNNQTQTLDTNHSIFIPPETGHSLANREKINLIIIETQSDNY